MRKLKLELEALAVESFDTRPETPRERGTVAGHAVSVYANGYNDFQESDLDWSLVTDCLTIADATCSRSCGGSCPVQPNPYPTVVVTVVTCPTGCGDTCMATGDFACCI